MAKFTNINSSAGLSTTDLDLGTITNEEVLSNFGTVSMPVTFQGPDATYTFNIGGGERHIIISGIKSYSANYHTQLLTWTDDIQKLGNFQNISSSGSWFVYQNEKSNVNDIYNGITVKMVDLKLRNNKDDPVNIVTYFIRLVQTRQD